MINLLVFFSSCQHKIGHKISSNCTFTMFFLIKHILTKWNILFYVNKMNLEYAYWEKKHRHHSHQVFLDLESKLNKFQFIVARPIDLCLTLSGWLSQQWDNHVKDRVIREEWQALHINSQAWKLKTLCLPVARSLLLCGSLPHNLNLSLKGIGLLNQIDLFVRLSPFPLHRVEW